MDLYDGDGAVTAVNKLAPVFKSNLILEHSCRVAAAIPRCAPNSKN
jgi:hypothetical protein